MWCFNHGVDFAVPAANTVINTLKCEGWVPDKKRSYGTLVNRKSLTISENNQVLGSVTGFFIGTLYSYLQQQPGIIYP